MNYKFLLQGRLLQSLSLSASEKLLPHYNNVMVHIALHVQNIFGEISSTIRFATCTDHY